MAQFLLQDTNLTSLANSLSSLGNLGYGNLNSYQHMPLEKLKEHLARIKKDFAEEDYFYIFTQIAEKINIRIHNNGHQYLDDATITLTIPRSSGLLVADKIPVKPMRGSGLFDLSIPNYAAQTHNQFMYPKVELNDDNTIITANLGQIQNGMPKIAFGKPLRVILPIQGPKNPIPVATKLVARGLKIPLEDTLYICPE